MAEPVQATGLTDPAVIDEAVAAFAARPVIAIALDFDGVLAPLGVDPMQVRMVDGAAEALAALAQARGCTVALVSGRRLPDILALASPPDAALLATSHGAELTEITPGGPRTAPLDLTPDQEELLARVDEELVRIAAAAPGAWVERKPFARVLHTRQAGEPNAAVATGAALTGPASWPGTHTIEGKAVVEIAVIAITKADGVAWVRQRAAERAGVEVDDVAVLFAGDDRTDEDALRVLGAADLGVKVGPGETAARIRVPDEPAVVALLRRVLAAR